MNSPAFMALTLLAPALRDVGRWKEISSALHAPLEQGAILTTRGAANPAAARYLAYLRTPAARKIFEHFGFRLPPANPSAPEQASRREPAPALGR